MVSCELCAVVDGSDRFSDLICVVCNTSSMQAKRATSSQPLVEAVLSASRVLVGIAARSLTGVEDEVTLAQYRTLVVLRARGPQSLLQLADELQVVPSTATRMCDRLVRKELIGRGEVEGNRREVELAVTKKGTAIVNVVTRRRRAEISRIVARMSESHRVELVEALQEFARAADEPADQAWFLEWS
jgi:DNA-binding MarR family transcriptional regulator